jgi:nitrate/nitrite-specific signal transduction histidine kinase
MLRLLQELKNEKIEDADEASKMAFNDTVTSIEKFANQADGLLTKLQNANENWFWKSMIKLFVKK